MVATAEEDSPTQGKFPTVKAAVTFLGFNSDSSCLCVGTTAGFLVWSVRPLRCMYTCVCGPVTIVEMLLSTSLVAAVGSGMSSSSSRRMLRLYNCKPSVAASSSASSNNSPSRNNSSLIACVVQPYAICGVKITPARLVVLNEKHISIFVLQSLTLLRTLERHPVLPQQPRGFFVSAGTAAVAAVAAAAAGGTDALPPDSWVGETAASDGKAHAAAAAADATQAVMAVGWSPQHSYLALPAGPQGGSAGVLCLFDLLSARFAAWRCTHEAPLRSIAFSASASLVAAISSKGSVVRILSVPSLELLLSLHLHHPQMLLQGTKHLSMHAADPRSSSSSSTSQSAQAPTAAGASQLPSKRKEQRKKAEMLEEADAEAVLISGATEAPAGAPPQQPQQTKQAKGKKQKQKKGGCVGSTTQNSSEGTAGVAPDIVESAATPTASAVGVSASPASFGPVAIDGVRNVDYAASSIGIRASAKGRTSKQKQRQLQQQQQQEQPPTNPPSLPNVSDQSLHPSVASNSNSSNSCAEEDTTKASIETTSTAGQCSTDHSSKPSRSCRTESPGRCRKEEGQGDSAEGSSSKSGAADDHCSKARTSSKKSKHTKKNTMEESTVSKATRGKVDGVATRLEASTATPEAAETKVVAPGPATTASAAADTRKLSSKRQQKKEQRELKEAKLQQRQQAPAAQSANNMEQETQQQESIKPAEGKRQQRNQEVGEQHQQQEEEDLAQTENASVAEDAVTETAEDTSQDLPSQQQQTLLLPVAALHSGKLASSSCCSLRNGAVEVSGSGRAGSVSLGPKEILEPRDSHSGHVPTAAADVGDHNGHEPCDVEAEASEKATSTGAETAKAEGSATTAAGRDTDEDGWVLCGTPMLSAPGASRQGSGEYQRQQQEDERNNSGDSSKLSADWNHVETPGAFTPSGCSSPYSRSSSNSYSSRAAAEAAPSLFSQNTSAAGTSNVASAAAAFVDNEVPEPLDGSSVDRHNMQMIAESLKALCEKTEGAKHNSCQQQQQMLLPPPTWLTTSENCPGETTMKDQSSSGTQQQRQHQDQDATGDYRQQCCIVLTGEAACGALQKGTGELRKFSLAFSGCSRIFTVSKGDGLVFVFVLPWSPEELQKHSKCGVAVQQQLLRALMHSPTEGSSGSTAPVAPADAAVTAAAAPAAAPATATPTPPVRGVGSNSSKLSSITGAAASALASVTSMLLPASISERLLHARSCDCCISLPSTAEGCVACVAPSDLLPGDEFEVVVGLDTGFAYTYSCQLNPSCRYRLRDEQILETQRSDT